MPAGCRQGAGAGSTGVALRSAWLVPVRQRLTFSMPSVVRKTLHRPRMRSAGSPACPPASPSALAVSVPAPTACVPARRALLPDPAAPLTAGLLARRGRQ